MADHFGHQSYKLHDSIYSSCLIKADGTPRTETESDGKSTALSFFRCLESIDTFIHHSDRFVSDEILVCSSCCDQMIKSIERAYKCSQEQARSYSVTIHEYQTEYPSREIYSHEAETNENHDAREIHSTSLLQQSAECELDLQRHIKDIEDQHSTTMTEIEKELLLLASIESDAASLDSEIALASNHSDKLVREMNFLSSNEGCLSVLFDLSISNRSNASNSESNETMCVINGMRLMYLPSYSDNLNWAEINQAWSCLSLLVCCLRSREGLQEQAVIVIGGDKSDSPKGAEQVGDAVTKIRLTLQLRPLRRRTLILLSLDHCDPLDEANTSEEVLFLCGEGSGEGSSSSSLSKDRLKHDEDGDDDDESDDFLGTFFSHESPVTSKHQRLQYYKAVVSLAAVVCATARDLNRLDCLTNSLSLLDLGPLLDPNYRGQRVRADHPWDLQGSLCRSVKNLMARTCG